MQNEQQAKAYKKLMAAIKDKKINFGKIQFLGVSVNKMSKKDLMCALAYSMSLNLTTGKLTPEGRTIPLPKKE